MSTATPNMLSPGSANARSSLAMRIATARPLHGGRAVTSSQANALGPWHAQFRLRKNGREPFLDNRGTTGHRVPLDRSGRIPLHYKGHQPPRAVAAELNAAVADNKRKLSQLRVTNLLTATVARSVLAGGAWSTGEALRDDHRELLNRWALALQKCGKYVELHVCNGCHKPRVRCDCCAIAPCVREQKKRSAKWVRRAERLFDVTPPQGKLRWRLVTMSLRQTGDVEHDLGAALALRAKLMRLLSKKHGMRAAVGAVELGEHANVHVHAIVYSGYVPRPELQTWLRAKDCTVPACRHPADDRCDHCKTARSACSHRDGDRERCNGSWVVDLREVRGRKGLIEALKYAAAPVILNEVPRAGQRPTDAQLAHAERLLRFFVALHNRHRVETYGAAKTDAVEPDPVTDVPPEEHECPRCQGELRCVVFGYDDGSGYRWFFSKAGTA